MFERYTDRARRVIVLADKEARQMNSGFVGTEHLLVGLTGEGGGVAFKALDALGVTEAAARDAVLALIPAGSPRPAGNLAFTPRAKKVLELAVRESLQLGCNYIATEHQLLGLIREGDGIGVKALAGLGVEPGDVRRKVLDLLRGYERAEAAGPAGAAPAPSLCSLPWRTGTHNNRTIYAVTGTGDHYEDVFIGTLDSAELVREAVDAHNVALASRS